MQNVTIKCPMTGKDVFTGIVISVENFQTSSFTKMTLGGCPHCGGDHEWNKQAAFLK